MDGIRSLDISHSFCCGLIIPHRIQSVQMKNSYSIFLINLFVIRVDEFEFLDNFNVDLCLQSNNNICIKTIKIMPCEHHHPLMCSPIFLVKWTNAPDIIFCLFSEINLSFETVGFIHKGRCSFTRAYIIKRVLFIFDLARDTETINSMVYLFLDPVSCDFVYELDFNIRLLFLGSYWDLLVPMYDAIEFNDLIGN